VRILIYTLGAKGFSVIRELTSFKNARVRLTCVVGNDEGIADDYSEQTLNYCKDFNIETFMNPAPSLNLNNYDFILAVGWRWMIRGVPKKKLIIFHDSLLPKYRGFSPLVSALINQEEAIGVTALFGADTYDTGEIILQKAIKVTYPTCIAEQMLRVSELYASLAGQIFQMILDSSIYLSAKPQNELSATYSLWRDEQDYQICWTQSATEIQNFINSVGYPYKGASAILDSVTVRVFCADVLPDRVIENRSPGKVIFVQDGYPVVVCGSGLLLLRSVQKEDGQSVLPLKKFRSRFL